MSSSPRIFPMPPPRDPSASTSSAPALVPETDRLGILASLHEVVAGNRTDDLLDKVTEAARILTGASAVALALRKEGRVICLARSGENAPELGSPLSEDSGISGECLRTGQSLLCDETLTDPRVDAEVCQRLGVRSIAAIPLRAQGQTVGILEAFSASPQAFLGEHLSFLTRVAEVVEIARPDLATSATTTDLVPSSKVPAETPASPQGASTTRRYWVPILAVAAVVLALIAVWFVWRARSSRPTKAAPDQVSQAPLQFSTEAAQDLKPSPVVPPGATSRQFANQQIRSAASVIVDRPSVPSATADLVAPDVISRPTPLDKRTATGNRGGDVVPAPEIALSQPYSGDLGNVLIVPAKTPVLGMRVSEGVTPTVLLSKTVPVYPLEAARFGMHGKVVLRATVAEDGHIEDLKVLEGQPILAKAALDAVRKWRYRPFLLDGKPTKTQADITVVFKEQ